MQTAHINGIDLAFQDSGGKGPVVILSHGFLMDHTMFDTQVAALTTTQTMALSSTQFGQITNAGGRLQSPIVLDLDGNGIQTLSVSAGVNFDLLANGQPVQTGWVGSGDGLP